MKYLRLFGLFIVIIIITSVFVVIEVFITNQFNLQPEIVGFCGLWLLADIHYKNQERKMSILANGLTLKS